MSETSREHEKQRQRLEEELFTLSKRNAQLEGELSYLIARNKVLERDRKQLSQAQTKLEKVCLSKERDFHVRNMFGERINTLRKQIIDANLTLEKVYYLVFLL